MPTNARAQERTRTFLRCTQCERETVKCSDCGEYFKKDQKISCVSDGLKHKCEECA